SGGGVSIGGARSEQNAFQMDGVTNSDQWDNGIAFRPSIDAIEEFKIEVNNYSAEFGKGAGGQINVVTKSGTNQFHGSATEFTRKNRVQEYIFFQGDQISVKGGEKLVAPPYNHNEFGVARAAASSRTGPSSSPTTRDSATCADRPAAAVFPMRRCEE